MKNSLTIGSWGNLSVRAGESFAITPSGLDYSKLTANDVVIFGEPSHRKPSSESPLHAAIYKARRDVNAIVHTHSIFATALAAAHKDLPIITEDGAMLAIDVIHCATYALAGTKELADAALMALGANNACLLANHGALVCAATMKQALLFANLLEKMAKIYYLSQNLGGAKPLPEGVCAQLRKFYFGTYARLQEE